MKKKITLNKESTSIKTMKNVFHNLLSCLKFITGWLMWTIIFLLSLVFSTITWNWKETQYLNMENVITEICGKSTWDCMMLNAT